jgi:hypothetical protein
MITHQINNQPYIDLTPHIDFASFEDIEMDIILGIVKSKNHIVEAAASKKNFYNNDIQRYSKSLLDISWPEILKDTKNLHYEQYKELNFDINACRMFNKYAFDTIQMGQALELRSYANKQFHLKDSAEHCFDKPCIINFPSLMNWIKNIDILAEVGRIIFFFNSPHDTHAVHKDHFFGIKEQFILINLWPNRKEFFILHDNGEKLIVNDRAVVFDPRNYHGTCGKTFYGWTLRIDGKFNKEWTERAGIWEHFQNNS